MVSVLPCIIFLIFNNIMHRSRFCSIGWPNILRCMCLPHVHYLLPLGLFLYLVILHNAAMTMGVKISMDLLFFSLLNGCLGVEILDDMVTKFFFLQRLYVCVCVVCYVCPCLHARAHAMEMEIQKECGQSPQCTLSFSKSAIILFPPTTSYLSR